MSDTKPLIYNFIDYADFLGQWFEYQKNNKYGFSYRSFNRLANIDSPNYMQRIISRQRKMSEKYLANIIAALSLDESEAEYFTLLVKIDRCRNEQEREELTSQLIEIRAHNCSGKLTLPMLHYLSHWYYPVIREIIVLQQTTDCKRVADVIAPSISLKKVSDTIAFLIDNDYISYVNDIYVHTSPILTTGDEVMSDIVNHFHRESLLLCAEDLTNTPLEERDISSLILSLSRDSFSKVKKEIQLFRKKLLQISEEESQADAVYHVGFQLVARSDRENG